SIDPSLAGYDAVQGRARLLAALERVRRLPGVAVAAANSQVPFGDFHEGREVLRPGRRYDLHRTPTYTIVTADYFKAIGLPILRGRDFTPAEETSASKARVAIIDEPLARLLFDREDPLGQPLVIPPRANRAPTDENDPLTIVGIVPGVRDGLTDREPAAHLYVPPTTRYRGTMHLHVRTAGANDGEMLNAIRREIRAVDDRLPVVDLRTMQDFHNRGLSLWV